MVVSLGMVIAGPSLPSPAKADPLVLRSQPYQREIDGQPFTRSLGDIVYTFTPRAEYEISGVVVSLHHSDSFTDITHENDPANTLDLCLVWGENVLSDVYRKVEYSHGDFTCFYRWHGKDPGFRGDQMSNTHILPSTPKLARLSKSVRVGDQITLKGTLVDYRTAFADGREIGWRNTSLTRKDAGNGACEILYLEDFQLLMRHEPWRTPTMLFLFWGGFAMFILSFFFEARKVRSALSSGAFAREPEADFVNSPNSKTDKDVQGRTSDKTLAELK